MDDIERELKLIQIQRERLALERELAIRGAGNSALHAASVAAAGVAAPFRAIGRALGRWWKALLGVLLVLGSVAGALGWKEYQDREDFRALEQRWNVAKEAYSAEQCPELNYSCSNSDASMYLCMSKERDRKICVFGAWSEYMRRFPAPKFR